MWDLIVSVPDHCLSFYFVFDNTFLSLYILYNLRYANNINIILFVV